ncbi:MAG: hypothetical protein MK078_09895 [Crocinitomicaceae bacterium]|nr:hypothetical protein [Crocinitomicaceae bacterium]
MIRGLIIGIVLSITSIGYGQYDMGNNDDTTAREAGMNRENILGRAYVGGELSLQFGTFTRVYLAPMAGYDITRSFSGGVSIMYQLLRQSFLNGGAISSHTYGGGLFLRYRPIPQFIAQTEFNLFNTEDFASSNPIQERVNVPVFMAGLGYAGDFGGRAYYNALLMYDFVRDPNMPLPQLIPGIPLYLKLGMVFYLGERTFQ